MVCFLFISDLLTFVALSTQSILFAVSLLSQEIPVNWPVSGFNYGGIRYGGKNIAGWVAISIGGPGATFWLIVAGLLGMSTKLAECTLESCIGAMKMVSCRGPCLEKGLNLRVGKVG